MKQIKDRIIREIDRLSPHIINIAKEIHNRPELLNSEFFASDYLSNFLSENGFNVTKGVAGLKTAFWATSDSKVKSPSIALIAEYDALPDLGHACGHNLIAASSAGAGAALICAGLHQRGDIIVAGTPAEEGGGGKISMINKGMFDKADAALMAHPSNKTRVMSNMLALVDVTFIFTGKPAHAAASPYKGINALDGVIQTFNNINALRQQIRGDARIHGIITEGGLAPNIIPARAVCHFYVRAADLVYFNDLLERTKNCARGAATATGCKLKIVTGKMVYHPFRVNHALAGIFREQMENLGIKEDIIPEAEGIGSSDIGNISQILPTIHPEFSIGPDSVINHTPEFTKASVSDYAMKRMITICKALALTAADLILFPQKLKQVKSEFRKGDT